MINRLAIKLAMKESKEHAIASPTPVLVHLSTYPLKLAQKALEKQSKESKMKDNSEADSASANLGVLR